MIVALWFRRVATGRQHAYRVSDAGHVEELSLCGRVPLDSCEDEISEFSPTYSCIHCKGRQRGEARLS